MWTKLTVNQEYKKLFDSKNAMNSENGQAAPVKVSKMLVHWKRT